MMNYSFIAGSLAAAALCGAGAAIAQVASTGSGQAYPVKPVRIVVTGVGSGGDFAARLISQGVSPALGHQIIVDNRGSGNMPAEIVAKSPPDGYTLCLSAAPLWITPFLRKTPYDPVTDFAPVTLVVTSPNILVVHPSVPATTLPEFIAYAKANPGKLSYSSGLVGTSPQLSMEWLKQRLKFDIVSIPYKNAAQGTMDVISGQLPINVTNFPFVIPFAKSGRLRPLAVTSAERQAQLPDVPTVQESGVPGYEVNSWYGVCAPAAVPVPILDKLNADITSILRTPDMTARLTELVIPPSPTTREEFDRFMRAEIDRWAAVIKSANIPRQ